MSRRSVWVLAWAVAIPLLTHAADDPGKPTATLRIDPASPEVGGVFQLVLEVHAPRESVVALPGKAAPLQPFEVIDYDSSESNEGAGLVARGRYKLLGSLAGKAELGPLTVRLKLPDGKEQDLLAETVSFELKSVLATLDPAPSDILPIKGPVQLPETGGRWSRWGMAGAFAGGVALIALTVWLLFRRRKPVTPPEAAHVVAMRQLQELTRRELDSSDAVERFYVELSGVVRRYLERRFQAPVMEQTTQEIKRLFDPGVHGANWTFRLHQLLERMDLVKFARFRISTSAAFEDLQMAETLIQEVVERDAQAEAERLRQKKLEPVGANAASSRSQGG